MFSSIHLLTTPSDKKSHIWQVKIRYIGGTGEFEAFMYRIVKRIVHTITTVTLLVRWEDSARQKTVEEQITLPPSYSLTEEAVADAVNNSKKDDLSSNPTLDKGEKP
jgi:hypothetical protein